MPHKRRAPGNEPGEAVMYPQQSNNRPAASTCGGILPFANFFCPASAAPAHSKTNSIMAFDSLTPEEQDQVYRDLYGVDDIIEEHEEYLAQKLQELLDAVQEMPDEKKGAYNLALMQDATNGVSYVQSPEFQLMFLRTDKFNAAKAASRMVKHFKYKLDLFGEQTLARPIKQSDLDEDDMEALLAGGARPLGHDRAGRGVFWARRMDFKYKTIDNLCRAVWYIFMVMVEHDVEIQRKGLVTISYNVGYFAPGMFNRQFYKAITTLTKTAIPCRTAANHHCYNDFKEVAVTQIMQMFLSKDMKSRYRGHVGGCGECLFKLMTFGINPDTLPVNMEGEIDYESHLEWVRKRQEIENGGSDVEMQM